MSKQKKVYDNKRPIVTTNKHVLWLIKVVDGEVLYEKFDPDIESKYGFFEIERSAQFPPICGDPVQRWKLNIFDDVEFFSCEKCNLKRFFGKYNTFSHMEKYMDLPEAVLRIIVFTEDYEEYDRIEKITKAAEKARKEVEERGRDYIPPIKPSEIEYS